MATLTDIQKVRLEIQDNTPGLYLISDDEVQYFLDKNAGSVVRASIDAAKTILFKLSINSNDSTVDIFSIKGSKAAEQYRLALALFIKDPTLNPLYNNIQGYVGGISKTDMLNNFTDDNNVVVQPSDSFTGYPANYFSI